MTFVRYSKYPLPPYNNVELKEYDTKAVNAVFDDSCVDYTQHTPQGEITKALRSGQIQGMLAEALYDFPDGTDTGFRPPASRRKGADLAEVSTEVAAMNEQVAKDVARAKRRADAKAKESAQTGESAPAGDAPAQSAAD